jgi:hypothetical protein
MDWRWRLERRRLEIKVRLGSRVDFLRRPARLPNDRACTWNSKNKQPT